MKHSIAIAAGLLLAAGLASAAPGNARTAPACRPGLLGWLFGRRPVVVVRHAPRPVVRRTVRRAVRRHLGWTIGQHKGWYRHGKQGRAEFRRGHGHQDNEQRHGGGGRGR